MNIYVDIAKAIASKSNDPRTKVGAVIVAEDGRILSVGYNGTPRKFDDALINMNTDEKYFYMCHAELNAILNSEVRPKNCTLYCTHYPCNECAKAIVQSGINRVIYLNDYNNLNSEKSKIIFDSCKIKVEKMEEENENKNT